MPDTATRSVWVSSAAISSPKGTDDNLVVELIAVKEYSNRHGHAGVWITATPIDDGQ